MTTFGFTGGSSSSVEVSGLYAVPAVSIATTDGYASELGDTGTFTVTRANQSTALPLIVRYSTSGTAINGIDYATLTGTVTIPIGSTSATITIAPVDTAFSNDQTATVTLLSADDEDALYDLSGTSSGTVTLHSATSQIAWWKLDETSGTTASDSSGDNLVATVVGSPIWNTYGYLQGGLTLNGSSQYAYASNNVAFDLTTGAAMTISAWVLPGSFGTTSVYPILAHGTAYELSLAGGTTSKGVAFTVNGVTVNPSSNQTTLLGNGSWHLITATLSGGAATLYIDGTAVGTATGINLPATDTGTLYLGRDSTNYFNGTLDDVRMYSRALAASEVAALYNVPVVSVAATTSEASELGDTGTFTVTRTGSTADPLTVYYTVSGSDTTNGVSYVYLPGSVVIPAGQSSAAITVTPVDQRHRRRRDDRADVGPGPQLAVRPLAPGGYGDGEPCPVHRAGGQLAVRRGGRDDGGQFLQRRQCLQRDDR